MTDIEDRLRRSLRDWADEAPASLPWTSGEVVLDLAPNVRRPTPTRWVALAAVAAAAGLFVVSVTATREEEPVVSGQGLVRAEIPVGQALGVRVLTRDDATGALFVASENDARLYRIDPETDQVTEGPRLWGPDIVGAAHGSVYVVLNDPVRIARLDSGTLEEVASAEIAGTPTSTRPIGGELWVRTAERALVRMDLQTLRALPPVPFDHGSGFLAEGPAGVWLTDLDAGEVVQVDPNSGADLKTIELEGARGIAVGDGAVWVSDERRDRLVRIDPTDGTTTEVSAIGRRPNSVALDGDRVWVTTFGDGRLVGVDAAEMAVVTSVPVGLRPGAIVIGRDSVWVSVHQRGAVLRIDRERLRSSAVTTAPWTDTYVDVAEDGHLLLRCSGRGTTTVVLFPRDGADLGEWAFVQPLVAGTTRVCSYEPPVDDAGALIELGDAQLAETLRDALRSAGVSAPFVVVGSQGGSRPAGDFAQAFRDEVAGVVLVDPGPPSAVQSVVNKAPGVPLRALAEDPEGRRRGVPSTPQRNPASVVETILDMVQRS